MSDIPDAIARAQRDVEAKDSWAFGMGDDAYDVIDRLAALGPASVALAAALYARSHAGGCTPGKCDLCDALQDWADAQHSAAEGG